MNLSKVSSSQVNSFITQMSRMKSEHYMQRLQSLILHCRQMLFRVHGFILVPTRCCVEVREAVFNRSSLSIAVQSLKVTPFVKKQKGLINGKNIFKRSDLENLIKTFAVQLKCTKMGTTVSKDERIKPYPSVLIFPSEDRLSTLEIHIRSPKKRRFFIPPSITSVYAILLIIQKIHPRYRTKKIE